MFYNQINENYYQQDPYLNKIVGEVCEHFPDAKKLRYYVGDESYTINKEKVFICIRDKKQQKLYNENVLKYVILHEYAHSICPEIGHTDLYYKIFDKVLEEAIQRGLYNPNEPVPSDYCK